MGKVKANFWMAAILRAILAAMGFRPRDERIRHKTRRMYHAIVTRVYKGQRKHEKAIRRFVRSARADAKQAGMIA